MSDRKSGFRWNLQREVSDVFSTPRGLATAALLILLWSSATHYTTVTRERMRALAHPVPILEQEIPVSVTWQHTPEGAAGPLTITVTQRANEHDDDFDARLARRLAQYPQDPPEEG